MSDLLITFLGHAAFRIQWEEKIILIDPWIMTNPKCPQDLKSFPHIDMILVTHGHFDHMGDTIELAKKYQPTVVGAFELCHWLEQKGVEKIAPMNKGGTQEIDGMHVTMVSADHSSGILDAAGIAYGGEAAGFVIRLPNGMTIYHAGDTNVFSDMKLIGELYHPDIALLPIGGHFTMSPKEAAKACELMKPKIAVPMHYETFPVLKGTAEEFAELVGTHTTVKKMNPGETWRIVNGKL